MKLTRIIAALALVCLGACDKTTPEETPEVDKTSIVIKAHDWTKVTTKAYGNGLTTTDWEVGDPVGVVDDKHGFHLFKVANDDGLEAKIVCKDYELEVGKRYRVIYPMVLNPDKEDDAVYPCVGFGDYASESTDWFYSDFVEFTGKEDLAIDLKRMNSIINLQVTPPSGIDGRLEDIYLSTDSDGFCIKGDFDFTEDVPAPHNVSWEPMYGIRTAYKDRWNYAFEEQGAFYEKREFVKEGSVLDFQSTIYPLEYSKLDCYLNLLLDTKQLLRAKIAVPDMTAGVAYDFSVSEMEVLQPLIEIKDIKMDVKNSTTAEVKITYAFRSREAHELSVGLIDARVFDNDTKHSYFQYSVDNCAYNVSMWSDPFGTLGFDKSYLWGQCIHSYVPSEFEDPENLTLEAFFEGLTPGTEYRFIPYAALKQGEEVKDLNGCNFCESAHTKVYTFKTPAE